MNKLAKGAIATGVATAMFLGGGATLALWNDAVTVGASESINSGVLTLNATPGSWSSNPDLWVPGDSFTYTTDVSIVAKGDNLLAELSIDSDGVTGTPELVSALEYTIEVTNVAGGTLTPNGSDTLTVTPTNATSGTPVTAQVVVTVHFPESTTGLVAQGATAQLNDLKFLLSQVV